MDTRHKPEIMSPAGYWPQLHAAIEAGADAVYFGLKHFTARAKVGFTLTELPEVMRTLHQRGVRGYVTFNTLVFDHELDEAARSLVAIAEAGADAIIVQDVGVANLARQLAPDLEVHGSTQMSITSAEGVELARRFGVSRVVLARELALNEIRAIRQATDCELEMFVHGALCVSYSGQCFSSEAWGGRSANRGQCAQACRLPYELLVDGQLRPLGDARYLLSPGDLYTIQQIPEIVQLGVSALKIEGRYKDAEYVALTTAAYRKAVDEAWAGLPLSITAREEIQLEQVYSRGLGPYFVSGTNHQTVVHGRSPRHRGVLMGRVARVLADSVLVLPAPAANIAPLKPGDGLVFDAANWRSPEQPEEGGRIYQLRPARDGALELRFGPNAINYGRIRPGDLVWRSADADTERAARVYTQPAAPVYRQPLRAAVVAHVGQPLTITWTLVKRPAITVTVQSPEPLGAAQNRAADEAYLREQLGRLGNTAYELAELKASLSGQPFIPSSLLNNLRREATDQLGALQGQSLASVVRDPAQVLAMHETKRGPGDKEAGGRRQEAGTFSEQTPQTASLQPSASEHRERPAACLHLLVRTPAQLEAALALRPASITLDYLDLYGLRPAVEQIQEAGIEARVASPRVLKPNEQRVLRFLLKLGCPILVRSAGLLEALQSEAHPPLIGDFSLNAANALTSEIFLGLGLDRLTPTYDLNAAQISALAERIGPDTMEVVAYSHLPVFHTEHCVFCRFLSTGTSYKDCGHPCEKHQVALRDNQGRAHPVMADVGCRNTVFGAEAQEASNHLDEWRAVGIGHMRLEFVHESAEQVQQVVGALREYLAGTISAEQLGSRWKRSAPQSTSEGSLFVPGNYLAIPLMQ